MFRKFFSVLVFLASLSLVVYGGSKFIAYRVEMEESRRANSDIAELVVQVETEPEIEMISSRLDTEETAPVEETRPLEIAPVSVDFQELKRKYPDVIGWLYCADTPINYPVMGSRDNLDYIYALPDGTPNDAGSLFLDFRCDKDFLNGYSVIYGHNLKNDGMFGILEEYKKQEFYEEHPVMYLLTESQNYRVDLIGGFVTWGTSAFYDLPMPEDDIIPIINEGLENTTFTRESWPMEDVPFLLLSTCDYTMGDGRYILVGAMTEIG